MKTIAFIPARGGSKSIQLKNIKDFCGKPLIYWSLKALEKTEDIDVVYIATDSEKIAKTVEGFHFSKTIIYHRNAENAQDHSPTEDVMLEFINKNDLNNNDIFILVQVTSPLTESSDFSNALKLYNDEKTDSLLACVRQKRFFWTKDGTPVNYDYRDRPRRQDFEGVFWETGAFYINTVGNIKKYKNRLSGKIAVYEISENKAVDLDEPDDWKWAEFIMRKFILVKPETKKNVQLFATDVDGVLTDSGMYYTENGDELKKFNTRDGKGIELLHNAGIKTAIITSENTEIVERRAKKLKIDYVFQGVKNKLEVIDKLCKSMKIDPEQIAYMGDDINDTKILNKVGLSACPADAIDDILNIVDYVCSKNGGQGCVREFIDMILLNNKNI